MVLFLYACEFYIKVFFAPCVSVAKKNSRYKHRISPEFVSAIFRILQACSHSARNRVFRGFSCQSIPLGLTAIRIARSFSPLLLKAQVAYILYYSEMYLTLVSTSVFSSSASIAKRYVTTSPQSIAARISWMNTMF